MPYKHAAVSHRTNSYKEAFSMRDHLSTLRDRIQANSNDLDAWLGLAKSLVRGGACSVADTIYDHAGCLIKIESLCKLAESKRHAQKKDAPNSKKASEGLSYLAPFHKGEEKSYYKRAFVLDPSNNKATIGLADHLASGKKIVIDRTTYRRIDLYKAAIRQLDDAADDALKGRLHLRLGGVINEKGQPDTQHFIDVIRLPNATRIQKSSAWTQLAETIGERGALSIDGTAYNQMKCYEEAVKQNPYNRKAGLALKALRARQTNQLGALGLKLSSNGVLTSSHFKQTSHC